tara:strand:+ start:2596 stop:2937 length:342 start_codon:yes stop_codon:yes gene_type:complete
MVTLILDSYESIWGLAAALWRIDASKKNAYIYVWQLENYAVDDLKEAVFKLKNELQYFPTQAELHREITWLRRQRVPSKPPMEVDPEGQRKVRELIASIGGGPKPKKKVNLDF